VTLSAKSLNRTLLARQLLLARARLPLGRALERVAGLQAQYAPSPYIRLWSMLGGFSRNDLTRALERRRAVQGTLMRSTIHLVSPRDYWRFAAGIGPSRRDWWLRTWGRHEPAENVDFVARELEAALAGRTWHRKEIDALLFPRRARPSGRACGSRSSACHLRGPGSAGAPTSSDARMTGSRESR
jgi:hypothetical protein